MSDAVPHIPVPGVPRARRTAHVVAITVVALLPVAVGAFHIFVRPIVMPSEEEATRIATENSVTIATEEGTTTQPNSLDWARRSYARTATLGLVGLCCVGASLVLGLLNVRHVKSFAFAEGLAATAGYIATGDAIGGCVAPFMFPLVFWPLILMGKGIGALVRRDY